MTGNTNDNHELYDLLHTEKFMNDQDYDTIDLDEGMAVIKESMWGWWKPRYLINHNTKCAYEFIDKDQKLLTVTEDDIDWESLKDLPEDAQYCARHLSFHYPSFIKRFENGVAEVSWQLNPDGRYYMDEDGYGMTDDQEIEIYGFIDQNARVVVKFKNVKAYSETYLMRKEAEEICALSTNQEKCKLKKGDRIYECRYHEATLMELITDPELLVQGSDSHFWHWKAKIIETQSSTVVPGEIVEYGISEEAPAYGPKLFRKNMYEVGYEDAEPLLPPYDTGNDEQDKD